MASNPSELSEQIVLVRALRRRGVWFCAVPNGGKRNRNEAARLKAAGVERGVPDLLIFDPPPKRPDKHGCALELKRQGARSSSLSLDQTRWLSALSDRGWDVIVAYGAVDALAQLKALGYFDKS